ncbi:MULTISPECIES: low molecular weight protein arginine phosphatase [Geomicrobium]|uniref:Protein-tyrosine phosphatase n=1 Tax=Geomicrobium sediminis TaxID=1347788 RepID=A0ABS2P7P4_9BACL|nr:low molecular weight protein arginine phosphatase [Geomicrobium sp. JCM 19055]MBM7631443.1 protein-tyrosine phosphatase [Geomicrobium sediminis]
MTRVLFVCTGNTCRSPMAEALLKHHTATVDVQSAGIHAFPGSKAAEHSAILAKEFGQSLDDHSAQQLDESLLGWADIVLTMTANHQDAIASIFPNEKQKVFTLGEFAGEPDANIQDPFGGSLEQYRIAKEQMERLIQAAKPRLVEGKS